MLCSWVLHENFVTVGGGGRKAKPRLCTPLKTRKHETQPPLIHSMMVTTLVFSLLAFSFAAPVVSSSPVRATTPSTPPAELGAAVTFYPKLSSSASSLRTGATCQYCYYVCCDNSGCCPLGTTCGTGSRASQCVGTQQCGMSPPNCGSASELPAWLIVIITIIGLAIAVCGCIANGGCPCPPPGTTSSYSSSPYASSQLYNNNNNSGYSSEQVYEKLPLQ